MTKTSASVLTQIAMIVDELYARLDSNQDIAWIDEMVHEAKAHEASGINNSGFENQVEYLVRQGFTPKQILGDE